MSAMRALQVWIVIGPKGYEWDVAHGMCQNSKREAIAAARAVATNALEIINNTDYMNDLTWAEAKAAGYSVKKSRLVVTA